MSNELRREEDLEALLKTYGARIFALALRLSCRTDEAEDIAQETFLKACEHWGDFRGEADAGTWLYRICVNVWKNRLRAEKRRRFWHFPLFSQESDDEEMATDFPASEPPIDAPLEAADQSAKLQHALAELDPEDRAILVMREIDNRSYEDIAALLAVPLGTVKSRLARTRAKMRKLYQP